MPEQPLTADAFMEGHPLGTAALVWVRHVLSGQVPIRERVGRSQVAFRGRRGYAYLWLPGRYLNHHEDDVVLSLALDHELRSPRVKEVAHPSPGTWMHHVEIRDASALDDELASLLLAAAKRAQ
jgi:hypothetical protein